MVVHSQAAGEARRLTPISEFSDFLFIRLEQVFKGFF